MKKYFYNDGKDQFGPFSLEELKEKEITRETMVWFPELGGWEKAGTIPELQNLFTLDAPPLQRQNNRLQAPIPKENKNSTIDIFVFLSIVYWFSVTIANFTIQKLVDNWYDTPAKFFQIFTNLVFAVIPIIFAISIKNKALKIIAIILGALLAINILYTNLEWLIRELN